MNHYEALEVDSAAEQRDIEKAFRRKARELHPDRHALLGPEKIKQANKAMAQIIAASLPRLLPSPLRLVTTDLRPQRRPV